MATLQHSYHHEAMCLMEAVMRDGDLEEDNDGGYECDDEDAAKVDEAASLVRKEMEAKLSPEQSETVSKVVNCLREVGDALNEKYKTDPVLQNQHMPFDASSLFTTGLFGELYVFMNNGLSPLVSKQTKTAGKIAIIGSVGKGVQDALRENGQQDPIELRAFKLLACHFIVDKVIPVGTSSVQTLIA